MAAVSKEILINATSKMVWEVLANIGAVEDYSPGIAKSFYTSEIKEGLGASRHCDLLPKGTVEERIVDWRNRDYYAIEIYDGTDLLYSGIAHFTVVGQGTETRVIQKMDYIPAEKLPASLEGKSMKGLVTKVVKGNLLGLKHFIETGEIVTREVFKRIRNREEYKEWMI